MPRTGALSTQALECAVSDPTVGETAPSTARSGRAIPATLASSCFTPRRHLVQSVLRLSQIGRPPRGGSEARGGRGRRVLCSAGPSARSPRADAARASCPLQDTAGTGCVFPRPRRTCLGGRSSQTHRLRSAYNEAGSGDALTTTPRGSAPARRSAGRGEGGSCAGSVQMSDFGQRSASEATPPPATTCHRGQSRPQRPTPGPTSARTLEGAGAAPPKRQWVSSPQRHAGTLLISACSYTRHPRAPSPSAPRFSYESQWISASAVLKSTLTPGSFRRCSQPEWEQGHGPQCSWPAPRARA